MRKKNSLSYLNESLDGLRSIIDCRQTLDERGVSVIEGGVHWVGNERALVSFKLTDEGVFKRSRVPVFDGEGISPVLRSSFEVH